MSPEDKICLPQDLADRLAHGAIEIGIVGERTDERARDGGFAGTEIA